MDRKALINGKEYRWLTEITYLDTIQKMILCEDNDGVQSVCSKQLWLESEVVEVSSATKLIVTGQSSTQEKIELFMSLFKGREDVFARRYYSPKTGKSGYAPACRNEWNQEICDKKKYRCPDCPNREFAPLTSDEIKRHLIGKDPSCRDVVGLYPMREDNTTYVLAVDFDENHWKEDVAAFCQTCRGMGLSPAAERSCSGNGAHVWFFF